MEPIDRRITAATLLALRTDPHAARAIAELLGVMHMDPIQARRTQSEIRAFVESGDATVAAQLIHTANLRNHSTPSGDTTPPR